jgi:hypothetical protein
MIHSWLYKASRKQAGVGSAALSGCRGSPRLFGGYSGAKGPLFTQTAPENVKQSYAREVLAPASEHDTPTPGHN